MPKSIYKIISGKADVQILENKFSNKKFLIKAESDIKFRLNTFYFPGWEAYLDDKKIQINANNDLKLITVDIKKGVFKLKFMFKNTNVRQFANLISIVSLAVILGILLRFHLVNSKK